MALAVTGSDSIKLVFNSATSSGVSVVVLDREVGTGYRNLHALLAVETQYGKQKLQGRDTTLGVELQLLRELLSLEPLCTARVYGQ